MTEKQISSACPTCGKERLVRVSRLKNGVPLCKKCAHEKCCGRSARLGALNPAYKGTAHIPLTLFHKWRKGATERNHEWAITIDEVERLYQHQQGKCAVSGATLFIREPGARRQKIDYSLISLDRIDSGKGYLPGNIQLVTWAVNRAKSNFSSEAFASLCRAVAGVAPAEPYQINQT